MRLQDGSHAQIHQTIYQLAECPDIKKAVAGVLAPTLSPGIDRVDIRERGSTAPTVTVNKQQADDIRASYESGPDNDEIEHEPQPVVAYLRVRSPTLDSDARQWRFYYGEDTITVDITDTKITANAIARGGAMIDASTL